MLVSRGDKLLFADADGATKFSDLDQLEARLNTVARGGLGVAVGSRAHMVQTEAVVKVTFAKLRVWECLYMADPLVLAFLHP